LSSGFQTAQVAHAVADFAATNPEAYRKWHKDSNYIVVLEAKNEENLLNLTVNADKKNIEYVAVREPDINDGLTAVLFLPGEKNRSFLSSLPCLGKNDPRQTAISASKDDILSAKAYGWQSRHQGDGLTYAVGSYRDIEEWEEHEHNMLCQENNQCWVEQFTTKDVRRAQNTAYRWGCDYEIIAVNPYKTGVKQ
jgi:hypothetical protein